MDLYKKQLDVYKEIVNGGLYDVHGVKIIIDLIKEEGYPEFLHDELVNQLTDAVNSIEKTRFDKISVVMKASERATKNLMQNFITNFQSENVTVTTIDYSKVPRERIPYKYRLKIYWKDTKNSVSLYFFNKYSNNVSNIKIDFNLAKTRNESLSTFSFLYNNLPETKALKIFHKATITRLERYILLSNIPLWGILCSRSRLVKGTKSFDARGNNNGVAASYYISKDNSKEIIVYDKFASDSKMDDDDPQKYKKNEDGDIKEVFQKIVSDLSKVETKVEVRNFKNRMNKKQRKKSLFFCSPSTFPLFLRDVQFYSPLLLKELSKSKLSKLIGSGFYNLIKIDKLNAFNKYLEKIEKYKIEIDKDARKRLESNFSLVFYAFLQDLGKEIGQSILDPDKPFSKKRRENKKDKKLT